MDMNSNKNNEKKQKDKKNEDMEKEDVDGKRRGSIRSISNKEGIQADVEEANPFQGKTIARSPPPGPRAPSQKGSGDPEDEISTDTAVNLEADLQKDSKLATRMETPLKTTEDNDPWNDEDIGLSPIFQLYEALNTPSYSGGKGSSPRKKKRKREEKEESSKPQLNEEMVALFNALKEVTEKTEELLGYITAKTKNEIKTASSELGHAVKILNKKANELKQIQEELPSACNAQVQEKTEQLARSSVGVQANETDIVLELAQRRKDVTKEIVEAMGEEAGWEKLAAVLDYDWPETCYKNTTIVDPKSLRGQEGNIAIITHPEVKDREEGTEDIKESFPELVPLMKENLEEGAIEYAKTKTKIQLSKGGEVENSRILFILPYTMDLGGVNDLNVLYNMLGRLATEMAKQGADQVRLAVLGNLDTEYLRKCVEHVFRKSQYKIEIVAAKKRKSAKVKKVSHQLEKVVVSSDGKQYADILRSIKSSVNIDDAGIKIKSIKKTAKGDVMLEVLGGKDKAEALKREIVSGNSGTRAVIKNNEETVYVTGIECDVTSEELIQAIAKDTGNTAQGNIRVMSIRPNLSGSQNATLIMDRKAAYDLSKRGSIKIGWTSCRVRLQVNIVRCYRCLEFGHHRRECKGDDKGAVCMKCGKVDHKAKACTNTSFCLTCKKEGHRADQTKCPHYRRLVQEKAAEILKGRGPRRTDGSVGIVQNKDGT